MGTTIAAISTPQAAGGIGIVRISGGEAFDIAGMVFKPVSSRNFAEMKGYTAAYGHVCDGGDIIDEAVALVFRAPKSYTGEDVIELSCHGGIYILRRLLAAVIKAGARLAGPGEFTKRAFLNGKTDLTRAESVMNLINAQGRLSAGSAIYQREGALFNEISAVKEGLVETAGNISAWIDFPDDDIPGIGRDEIKERLSAASKKLSSLISGYGKGRMIREGIDAVIAGKPNVGKSTLMNMLTGCERSIVTDVAGTTRDVIEESVMLGDVVLRLSDTAGLRETGDAVEKIGVARAREKLAAAALIFAVFDSSQPLDADDLRLINETEGKPVIAVLNKCDLEKKADTDYIKKRIKHTVEISALKHEGADKLEKEAAGLLGLAGFDVSSAVLSNERQLEAAVQALSRIEESLGAINGGFTLDAVSVGIESAIARLSELTGESASEQIIENVFSKFCVGK